MNSDKVKSNSIKDCAVFLITTNMMKSMICGQCYKTFLMYLCHLCNSCSQSHGKYAQSGINNTEKDIEGFPQCNYTTISISMVKIIGNVPIEA